MAENHANPRDHPPVNVPLYRHQIDAYYFVLELFGLVDEGNNDEEDG